MKGLPLLAALLLACAGCQSYDIVQTNIFADDDGNVITVDYGHADSDHTNTFRAPTNGKEMEFKSRLLVKVALPDGDSFKAWQCMNLVSPGTMYKTDNEEWMILAAGFYAIVYHRDENNPEQYRQVFHGVLCDVSDREVQKDTRWKTIPKDQGLYRKTDGANQQN